MDLVGVARTIDHAVYSILNALAVVLWRLDSALIAMSLFGYRTQDWLMHRNGGGVWQLFDLVSGPQGFLGVKAWEVMLVLAIMLFGIARVARPFINVQPVDLGRMFLFAVFSYVVISSGSAMMIGVEEWRADLGGSLYQKMAERGTATIDVPGSTPSGEPIDPPQDLDGDGLVRGWEAVATSYFLVSSEVELNGDIPSAEFRRAYCLYDPDERIENQDDRNSEGCSPMIAWDEWDQVTASLPITNVWGIPLPSTSIEIPIIQEHPENRELGIRQSQAGVARLALGPVVALYPLLEANLSLMLALSAAIVYLTLPIVLLFGFFMFTESIATRLLMKFLHIIISTVVLNGLISLFLLLLINVSVNGSLSVYLGLVGVAVIGGFILTRVAAGTLKDTLSMALSAMGGIWMGAAVSAMGQGAAKPARAMLGAAKLGAVAAVMGAAGAGALDLVEPGKDTARSGLRDINSGTGGGVDSTRQYMAGALPAPLARMTTAGLDTSGEAAADPGNIPRQGLFQPQSPERGGPGVTPVGGWKGATEGRGKNGRATGRDFGPGEMIGLAGVGAAVGALGTDGQRRNDGHRNEERAGDRYSQDERAAVWRASQQVTQQDQGGQYRRDNGSWTDAGVQAVAEKLDAGTARSFQGSQGQRELGNLLAAQRDNPLARGWGAPEARQGRVDQWVDQAYEARLTGRGGQQAGNSGQDIFGERLAGDLERAVSRRSQEDAKAVLRATRQAAWEMSPEAMVRPDGRLTMAGQQAVRERLEPEVQASFQGSRGARDLAAFSAMTLQRDTTAEPEAFRQAVSEVQSGTGQQAPGRVVPDRLGMDPVAAGPYYANMNRFAELGDQAGLTPAQRRRLLDEVAQQGEATPELREEVQAALNRRGMPAGAVGQPTVDDIVDSARSLPGTLSGPMAIRWPEPDRDDAAAPTVSGELRAQAGQPATQPVVQQVKPQAGPAAVTPEVVVKEAAKEDRGRDDVTTGAVVGVAAGAAAAAASAAVAGEVRDRLAGQQDGTGAGRTGVADELKAQAAAQSQPAGTGGAQPGPERPGGSGEEVMPAPAASSVAPVAGSTPVAGGQNNALLQVPDTPGAEGGEPGLEPGVVAGTAVGAAAVQPGGRPPSEDREQGATLPGAETGGGDQGTADETLPDLRAQALEAMAREEEERQRRQQANERDELPVRSKELDDHHPPANAAEEEAGDSGDKVADAASRLPGGGQEVVPSGVSAVVEGQADRQPGNENDWDRGVNRLAEELRQVGARDDAVQVQPEVITDPGQTQKGETDDKEGAGGTQQVAGADARSILSQVQQQRVETEAAGGSSAGVVAELRQGRVDKDEAGEVDPKKRRRRSRRGGSDPVLEPDEEKAETNAGTGEGDPTAGRASSLMPHHRQDDAPQTEDRPVVRSGAGQAVQDKPEPGEVEKATKSGSPQPKKEATPQTGQDRPAIATPEEKAVTPGEGSEVTGAGRASGAGPVPDSFTSRPEPVRKNKRRRDPFPSGSSQQTTDPDADQQSGTGQAKPQSGSGAQSGSGQLKPQRRSSQTRQSGQTEQPATKAPEPEKRRRPPLKR